MRIILNEDEIKQAIESWLGTRKPAEKVKIRLLQEIYGQPSVLTEDPTIMRLPSVTIAVVEDDK